HKPTVISNALQFGGLIVIVASFILVDANNRTTLYTMWPVFGTALLLWSTTYYKGLVAKFLSNRLFVYLGKISYSLYLWHWPVISMADQVYFDIPLPVIILLVLLLAIGSYHLIESPCRKRNKPFVGIAIGFTVALALTVFMMNRTSSYDVSMFSEDKISYDQYDVSPYLPRRNKLSGTVVPDCTTVNTLRIQQNGLIKNYGKEGQKPDIVVLGDSHALMWASLIDDISRELKISVAFFPVSGVPPFFKIPPVNQVSAHGLLLGSFHVEILNRIEQWKPIVIISMRWSHCMETTTYDLLDLLHTLGCSVVLIEDPPELYFEHSNTMQHLAFRGKYPVDGSVQYLEQRRNRLNLTNKTFNVLLSKYDNCSSVLVKDLFLKEGKVWVLDGRKVLYHDGDHLNNDGILKVKERMKCKIDEVIKKSNNQ
ncbi:MAG: acyltransferase, partial [Fibrobacteres bacterium]|nr:acyltransferase [Fibrobacterota bacterium]